MSFFDKIGSNIKKNVKSSELKDTGSKWAWGVLGMFTYLAVPAIVKRFSGWDTSGYKGMVIGAGSAIFIAFASDKKEMAIGGLTGVASHLLYNHVNEPFTNIVGEQFFPFDRLALEQTSVPVGAIEPQLKEALSDSINQELPPSLRQRPDGTLEQRKIVMPDGSNLDIPQEVATVSPIGDSTNDLRQATNMTNSLEVENNLSDDAEIQTTQPLNVHRFGNSMFSGNGLISGIAV